MGRAVHEFDWGAPWPWQQSRNASLASSAHRFTVDEFARMGEAGICTGDDRVELIDGEIVEMTPIGALHAGLVSCLTELIVTRLSGRARLRWMTRAVSASRPGNQLAPAARRPSATPV